jgi:hypothetical protein
MIRSTTLRARLAFLLLVALVAFAPGLTAQTIREADGVRITLLDTEWPGFAGRGYGELRFRVENGSDDPRQVAVFVGPIGSEDGSSMAASAAVTIEANATRDVALLLPLFAESDGNYIQIRTAIGGSIEYANLSVTAGGGNWLSNSHAIVVYSDRPLGGGFSGDRAAALSNAHLGTRLAGSDLAAFDQPAPEWYQQAEAWVGAGALTERYREQQRRRTSVSKTSLTYSVAVRATDLMPSQAAAFTSLDAVVLDGGPVEATRLAELARWVRLGGCVVVARDGTFSSFGDLEDARRDSALLCRLGDAEVRRLGLGTVIFAPSEPLGSDGQLAALWWTLERAPSWFVPRDALSGPNLPLRWHLGRVDLPGVGQISHRGLLVILVVMALVMAPLNVWLVRRSRRPAALLVTIPLLSLIGSLAVVGYGVIRDGLGVVEGVRSFAVLDQESQMVSSVTQRSLFLGSGASRRLAPGAGTVVLPFAWQGTTFDRFPRHTVARDLDSGLVTYSGGWLPVRRTFAHQVMTDRTTRRHLAARREGENVVVENALDAGVLELWLRDRRGDLWRARGACAPGATATLERSTDEAALEAFLVSLAPGPYMPGFERLAPGSYAARLDTPIGDDDCGVTGERTFAGQSLVGILETEALR